MWERQLAASKRVSQHAPSATRLVEMEHMGELVSEEQFDRVVAVEHVIVDRRVRERDDPVRGNRRGRSVEDIALIDNDDADFASRVRSIGAAQTFMRRFSLNR